MTDAQTPQAHGGTASELADNALPEKDATGLSAEEFSALAERFSAAVPLLRTLAMAKAPPPQEGAVQKGEVPAGARVPPPHKKRNSREALLCALKPYLSPERQKMADYLIRVCRIYDAVRELL